MDALTRQPGPSTTPIPRRSPRCRVFCHSSLRPGAQPPQNGPPCRGRVGELAETKVGRPSVRPVRHGTRDVGGRGGAVLLNPAARVWLRELLAAASTAVAVSVLFARPCRVVLVLWTISMGDARRVVHKRPPIERSGLEAGIQHSGYVPPAGSNRFLCSAHGASPIRSEGDFTEAYYDSELSPWTNSKTSIWSPPTGPETRSRTCSSHLASPAAAILLSQSRHDARGGSTIRP